MAETDVEYRVTARDDTKKGLNKAKQSFKSASKDISKSSGRMVPAELGDRMGQFNEKTEKMRQLINLTGTSMGKMTGELVYYGGTLSSVAGKFSLVEIGIFAVTAAVAILGSVLGGVSDEQERWNNYLDATEKKLRKVTEANNKWLESQKLQREGWTEHEKRLLELGKIQDDNKTRVDEATEALRKYADENTTALEKLTDPKWREHFDDYPDELVSNWTRAFMIMGDAQRNYVKIHKDYTEKVLDDEYKLEQDRKKLAAEAYKRRWEKIFKLQEAARKEREALQEAARKEAEQRLAQDQKRELQDLVALDDRRRRNIEAYGKINDSIAAGERAKYDKIVYWEDRISKATEDAQRERLEKQNEYIQNTISLASQALDVGTQIAGMLDLFGEASAKSEQERAKAAGKRLAFENTIKAATEVAESVAAFARFDFWGGAQHALAATLYTAAAIKAAAGGAGGGGRGAAGGAGAGGARGPVERPERAAAGGEGRGAVIIYVAGHQVFGTDAGRLFEDDINRYRDSINPGRTQEGF
jgi:hypothetical protein